MSAHTDEVEEESENILKAERELGGGEKRVRLEKTYSERNKTCCECLFSLRLELMSSGYNAYTVIIVSIR